MNVTFNSRSIIAIHRVKCNDPKLVELRVERHHTSLAGSEDTAACCYPIHDTHWHELCVGISKNTNLKKISVNFLDTENDFGGGMMPTGRLILLLAWMSQMEYLEDIALKNCDMRMALVYRGFVSTVKNNKTLQSIFLQDCKLSWNGAYELSTTLEERQEKSLKQFNLEYTILDDETSEALLASLKCYDQLQFICLEKCSLESSTCITTLSKVLANAESTLQILNLSSCEIDDGGIALLASSLPHNNVLKELDLQENPSITPWGWNIFLPLLIKASCKLESLVLHDNFVDDHNVAGLVDSLISNSSLKELQLASNYRISAVGWMAIARYIHHPKCDLEVLGAGGNYINDEVAGVLSASLRLAKKCSLKSLNLAFSRSITAIGWTELSSALSSQNSRLEHFSLCHSEVGDDVANVLADSLANNTKLKELYLEGNPSITTTVLDRFARILCDESSIESTYNSNHTLMSLTTNPYHDLPLPQDLCQYLEMNQNDKEGNGRQKIIRCHFCDRFSMEPFMEMNIGLMAHLLAWLCKIDSGDSHISKENNLISQTALFHFLYREPSLFGGKYLQHCDATHMCIPENEP